ncbi:MAG: hypothetical protein ACRCVJ_04595, partial [Clostridium sp.]
QIYYYLNNSTKYTKEYIQENFKSAITLLSINLKSYLTQNPNIKQYKLGEKQITYADGGIKNVFNDIKGLLPKPSISKAEVWF